jgi:hypothetical protein
MRGKTYDFLVKGISGPSSKRTARFFVPAFTGMIELSMNNIFLVIRQVHFICQQLGLFRRFCTVAALVNLEFEVCQTHTRKSIFTGTGLQR